MNMKRRAFAAGIGLAACPLLHPRAGKAAETAQGTANDARDAAAQDGKQDVALPKDFPPNAVDMHAHIFTQALEFSVGGAGYIPDYDAPIETYLRKIRTHHMTHGVLAQPSFLGKNNSYLLSAVQANADKLRCVVVVDPDISVADLRGMKAKGACGVRLIFQDGPMPDMGDAVWKQFLRNMRDLDLIIEMWLPADRIAAIAGPMVQSGCRVLIEHFGQADPRQGASDPGFQSLLKFADSGKVWVGTSGYYRSGPSEKAKSLSMQYYAEFKKTFGLDHIVWGSDWPCTAFESVANYDDSFAFMLQMLPTLQERQAVLWETPRKLFNFA